MEKKIVIGDVEKTLSIEKKGDAHHIRIDDHEYVVTGASFADGVLNFFVGNRNYRALVSKNQLGVQITLNGRDYILNSGAAEQSRTGGGHHSGNGVVEAPMPGNIVSVEVAVGDEVAIGDPVLVLESMKMQNEITAPVAGIVSAVNCDAGDQVGFGDVLVEIKPL